ncbi:MAG TPA: cellulase-like family protein [Acidobacteriaceae bacterium]|nr:cellulase-like family protein [Acidobacteriaceae bacterium]
MNRRKFLSGVASAAVASTLSAASGATPDAEPAQKHRNASPAGGPKHPRAITMWEFSWIERRWPGAGFEDWDRALDELCERGYNAVRIDPFPHLLGVDPHKEWTLWPEWNTQDWGSPDVNRIVLLPALFEFIGKCRQRGVMVGLSTWYRRDDADTRMKITSPTIMAENWVKTLDLIRQAGLLDTILYTDLCNEWPGEDWAPFMKPLSYGQWDQPASLAWMPKAVALVREQYPDIPLFFSVASGSMAAFEQHDLSFFDLLDPHIWMAQQYGGEFYKECGYAYERFEPEGYTNMSLKAESAYRARADYWQKGLVDGIDAFAAVSQKIKMPLITTECWGVVDYKDWPLLQWDWVQELCVLGAQHAASTGRWLAIASSNFCEPQFVGMWRDRLWHQRVTKIIRSAEIAPELRQGRLYARL